MPRHLLDKKRVRDDGHRAAEYVRIERQSADESESPMVKALHKARPAAKGAARSKAYHRIDKGQNV